MAELTKTNHSEIHSYSGSRDMTTGRRLRIKLTGASEEEEIVLDEKVPDGESWIVKLAIRKIINND